MGALVTAPGVISAVSNYYIGAAEVMEYLGCKENKAYKVIRGCVRNLLMPAECIPESPGQDS